MTEVNWDLAPEGAVELKQSTAGCYLQWFNEKGDVWLGYWKTPLSPSSWTTVATRPEPNEPRKTVEDAVKAFPDGWADDECEYLYWNYEIMGYVYRDRYLLPGTYHLVCTREQFEDCVKAKDGEKWTHTYSDYGVRKDCVLVHDKPDVHGQVLVLNRCDEYVLTGTVEIKPVNPIISDEQLSLILDAASAWGVDPDVCQDYLSGFKVEDTGDKCEF